MGNVRHPELLRGRQCKAYVVPTSDSLEAAELVLTRLGLRPELEHGTIYFRVPHSSRLHDVESVRRALADGPGRVLIWRTDEHGTFKLR